MKGKMKDLSISLRLLIVGVVIFCILYSGVIGMVGQALWNNKADGSLVKQDGEVVGSELIGQEFTEPEYFHGRFSSIDYNAMKSGSQNLAPVENSGLENRVRSLLENIPDNYEQGSEIPSVLVTESGSALDPHITVQAAVFQVPRVAHHVAEETSMTEEEAQEALYSKIEELKEDRALGLYGMKRINVLKLNLEVENMMGGM